MKALRRTACLCLAALLLLAALPASALTVDQARELLREHYVDEVPSQVLEQTTIPAMLEALGDPYTQYFTAQEYAEFMASMDDASLVGIGVTTQRDPAVSQGLVIIDVLDGSPAQKAGLQPGDVMVEVDGTSLAGLDAQDAIPLIRGEEGTRVTLTYLRNGIRHTRTLTRATVVIPATTGELLNGGVGYIQCTTWGDDTEGHFRDLIAQMDGEATSWLVDLRRNTGGTTDSATAVAGLFCGPGPVLVLRFQDGEALPFGTSAPALTDKPLVVLVDQYSASASEAFCAAIRDRSRGTIVGQRTFGKGVAQGLWSADSDAPEAAYFQDGDALKITTARFYSPLGNTNDTLGVIPDLLVDEPYILEVGWLLCEEFDPSATQNTFSFLWEDSGEGFTISLDHLAQNREDWAGAYTALIDALPSGLPLFHNDDVTVRRDLAQTLALPLAEPDFPDWTDAQFYNELGVLKAYGLVHGDEKGLFHPQDGLTRAQFCQMLYNLLPAQPPENVAPFDDVSPDAWYADAVLAMWSRGLVSGTGEGKFSPDQPMDLQQMFTIMGRLTRWINYQVDEDAAFQEALGEWPDDLAAYDGWAKPSVWTLCRGITGMDDLPIPLLWDDPEDLTPTDPATRDQAAFLLENLLYTLDLLP